MGLFSKAKKVVGAAANAGLNETLAQHKGSLDFLEGACAFAALVAAADGELEEVERRKTLTLLTNHVELGKIYDAATIEQTAEKMLRLAKDRSGKNQLVREIEDLKGKQDGSKMLDDCYLLGLDIAMADGEIEPAEKALLDKLAQRFGIDTAKFDLFD